MDTPEGIKRTGKVIKLALRQRPRRNVDPLASNCVMTKIQCPNQFVVVGGLTMIWVIGVRDMLGVHTKTQRVCGRIARDTQLVSVVQMHTAASNKTEHL
jgi:hypothetical protein